MAFQVQKNITKRLIFAAKDNYVNEQIDMNLSHSKKMRRNINTLTGLGQDRKSSSLKEVKNNEGTIVKDQEAADFMNEFYISAGPNLCSQPGGMKEILNHKLIQISALRS